jgi:hypothetical protein
MKLDKRTIIFSAVAAFVGLVIVILPLANKGSNPENWLLSARYTARFAFVLFLIPFVLQKWIARFDEACTRDSLLAFATAHRVHLGALITYIVVSETPLPPIALVVSGDLSPFMVPV